MEKILVPVDGTALSTAALEHVARLARQGERIEVHLLNVQEPVRDWRVRIFRLPGEIAQAQRLRSEAALEEASGALRGVAGVVCKAHVQSGQIAATIARVAHECGCDRIVMGTQGVSVWRTLFFRATAARVLKRSRVPVTLVTCADPYSAQKAPPPRPAASPRPAGRTPNAALRL